MEWAFQKLVLWKLPFDRIVFADSDILFLRNVDELFDVDKTPAMAYNFDMIDLGNILSPFSVHFIYLFGILRGWIQAIYCEFRINRIGSESEGIPFDGELHQSVTNLRQRRSRIHQHLLPQLV